MYDVKVQVTPALDANKQKWRNTLLWRDDVEWLRSRDVATLNGCDLVTWLRWMATISWSDYAESLRSRDVTTLSWKIILFRHQERD